MRNITLTRNGQTAPRDVETSTMHADGLAVGQGVMLRIKGDCCYGGPTPYKEYVVTAIKKTDRFDGKCSDVTFTVAATTKKTANRQPPTTSKPTTNKPTTNKPTANVPAVVPVAATRDRDAAYRLSRQYARVNGSWKNALEQTVRFGAMLKEWGDFLGDTQGREGEGLRAWLAENCPEINYQTAMGYKHLAEKTVRMLGGGAPAVAALLGRDTVTDPDGNEVTIDAEVVEKKEEIFREADSRRKLEQMYFDFMNGEGQPRKTRGKGLDVGGEAAPVLTAAQTAHAEWSRLFMLKGRFAKMVRLAASLTCSDASDAIELLRPLMDALRARVKEG